MRKAKALTFLSGTFTQRLTIKAFKSESTYYAALNEANSPWASYDGPLTPGTYAFVGGEWRNVKKIDPDLLPHV